MGLAGSRAGRCRVYFQNQETVFSPDQRLSALRIGASLFCFWSPSFSLFIGQFSVEAEGLALGFWKLWEFMAAPLWENIPGGVWHFVGRFAVYRPRGWTINSKPLRAFILENIWMLSAALVGTCSPAFTDWTY